jgi:hypothetical protein
MRGASEANDIEGNRKIPFDSTNRRPEERNFKNSLLISHEFFAFASLKALVHRIDKRKFASSPAIPFSRYPFSLC